MRCCFTCVFHCPLQSEDHSQDLVASGFPHDVVERAVGYMKYKGDHSLIDELKQLKALMNVGIFRESLSEMSKLLEFCEVFEVPLDKVCVHKILYVFVPTVYNMYMIINSACGSILVLTYTFHKVKCNIL